MSDPACPPSSASPITVLVVDDHTAMRETAVSLLHLLGHCTLQARNAREAEATIRREGETIQAVLLDFQLGDARGTSVAETLEGLRPGLRVLLMSGYGQEDLVGLGGRSFISKPFSVKALDAALQALLQGL